MNPNLSALIKHATSVLKKWRRSLTPDQVFYQMREGKRTKWVTREEWFREQKINPFASNVICGMDKKEIRYGK